MAIYNNPRPAPFGAVTTHRIVSAFDNLRETLTAWSVKRETRKQLNKLSDRELNDIGLSRSDIDWI